MAIVSLWEQNTKLLRSYKRAKFSPHYFKQFRASQGVHKYLITVTKIQMFRIDKIHSHLQVCLPTYSLITDYKQLLQFLFKRRLPKTENFHWEVLILLLRANRCLTHDHTRYNVHLEQKSEKETQKIKVTLTRKTRPELSSTMSGPAVALAVASWANGPLFFVWRTVFPLFKVRLAGMVT